MLHSFYSPSFDHLITFGEEFVAVTSSYTIIKQTFTAIKASNFVGNTVIQIIYFLSFLGINSGHFFQTNTIASSNDEPQNTSVNKKVSLLLKRATQYYSLLRYDQYIATTLRKSNNNKITHAV
jgi:hypothetical protein